MDTINIVNKKSEKLVYRVVAKKIVVTKTLD